MEKSVKYIIGINLLFFVFVNNLLAAPTIASVNGSIANGQQVVITGSNFGNKQWPNYGTQYHIGWPQWSTGHCKLNSDYNGYSSDFGNYAGWNMSPASGGMDGMGQKAEVKIAAYSFQVYQLY